MRTAIVRQVNEELRHALGLELCESALDIGRESVDVSRLERANEHLKENASIT